MDLFGIYILLNTPQENIVAIHSVIGDIHRTIVFSGIQSWEKIKWDKQMGYFTNF